jgi:hypothetical protein
VDRAAELAAFDQPVWRLDIDAEHLVPFHSGILRLAATDRVVQFPLGPDTLELAIVDVAFDPSFDVHHVTAIVLGTQDGYARFTVSLGKNVVVGTVYANRQAWRIAPAEPSGGYLVRRIRQPSPDGLRNDTRSATRPRSGFSALEARHVQMLRVAEINPLRFHTARTGSLVAITGEEIERIDLTPVLLGVDSSSVGGWSVSESALKTELTAALDRMRPLTMHDGPVELAIRSVTIGSLGNDSPNLVVRIAQLVHGIPAEPAGVITIDLSSGRIRDFAMMLVSPGMHPSDRTAWLSNQSAIALGQSAISSKYGRSAVTVSQSQLQYLKHPGGALAPEWLLYFDDGRSSYEAHIDAITGEARAYERVGFQHLGWQKICKANGQPGNKCAPSMPNNQAGQNTTPGYWKVVDRDRWGNGSTLCYPTSSPCDPRYLNGFTTVEQQEAWVLASGTSRIGTVDVLADIPGQEVASYDYGTRTVVLPPPGQGGYLPGVDPLSPAARQVMYHEVAHHHQNVSGGPPKSGVPILEALAEGLADANAALQTNDWILYDGILEQVHVRNIIEARKISDLQTLIGPHQQGKVFAHIIYSARQKPNVSDHTLANLVFETYRQMDAARAGDPENFDIADVHATMMVVAAFDPYLTAALEEVWVEMEGPPSNNPGVPGSGGSGGVPPVSGVPIPPSYVDGYFKFCDAPGVARHRNYWMSSYTATHYEAFYSTNYGGSYNYAFTTSATAVDGLNSADVLVAVKACNSVGCSWLSNDYYFQGIHSCFQ